MTIRMNCERVTTLEEAIKSDEVQDGDKVHTFGMRNVFQVIRSILHTLEKIHAQGKVHRDVKATHILLEYDQQLQKIRGILMDFKIFENFGTTQNVYPDNLDRCSRNGIVLPTCDIFGVAICLGRCFFGDDFFESMKRFDPLKYRFYLRYLRTRAIFFRAELKHSTGLRVEDCPTFTHNLIDTLIQIKRKYPQSREIVNSCLADMHAAKKVAFLLNRLFIADQDLYEFMLKPRGKVLLQCLDSSEYSSKDKVKKVYQVITNHFQVFQEFSSRVKEIQREWEAELSGLTWPNTES